MKIGFREFKFRKIDIIDAIRQPKIIIKNVNENAIVTLKNDRKIVVVHLTESMHKAAASFGVRIREKMNELRSIREGPREIYPGDYSKEVAGLEGAEAVAAYLFDNWRIALDYWTIGHPDKGDLAIEKDGIKYLIDIKTRTKPYHTCLRLTLDQWWKSYFSYYISCQYADTEGENIIIWGYAERSFIDNLVKKEADYLLRKPVKIEYEKDYEGKLKMKISREEFYRLKSALEKSEFLQKLKEEEVKRSGIYNFGYGPEIAIPFLNLLEITQLKEKIM